MINLDGTGGNAGSVWKVISTDANGQPTGTTTIPSDTTKRNIVTWVNKTTQAIDFTYANVIAAGNSLKGTNTNFQMTNGVTSDIIDYLRGVRTKEGNGMRKRTAILGDIVNSTPAFIKNNTNPLYENLPSTTPGLSSYAQYMTDKAARKEGILMVGANDGMVHAFGEGYQTSVGGRELFAFIPRSVLGKLESLTQVGYNYAHTYTVDGPLNETDAYLTTPDQTTGAATTGWRNVVVGTTGAGAKSVFALNATNPLTMNGRSVLWEINPDPLFPVLNGNSSTSFQELGSVLTHPQSGITVSGDWVTIFGNGYDSKSGRASLFVVETGTGKLLREITTDTLTGNGLGGVRLVLNGNQQIIGAYAGDLQGRVWKFDLSSTASSGWKLGNGGSPLFTAMGGSPLKALPITAAPAILERNDQLSFKPSYMVTVATGKLFEAADPTTTSPTQMTYGLWDKQPFGVTTTNTVSETDLESVRIMQVTAGVSATAGNTLAAGGITAFYGVGFSNPSVTTIDWTTKRGWKMSMDVYAGQRVVYPVQMVGDVVKIDSVAPEASASSCRNTDSNAMSLYFNPLTGACLKTGTVDINGDGVIDEKDAAVCAYSSTADGMDVILKILNPDGSDSNLRDIQNSNGHIKAKVRETPPKKDCSDPDYKVAHQQPAPVGCGPVADCSDPAYRQANSGSCPGSTLNRSWRQIFPRAN
jgi:type IV pilus assembly protein PilY1